MTYRARITDHWLPLPAALLAELGWTEGDEIAIEAAGDAVILSKSDGTRYTLRTAPPKGRKLLA